VNYIQVDGPFPKHELHIYTGLAKLLITGTSVFKPVADLGLYLALACTSEYTYAH